MVLIDIASSLDTLNNCQKIHAFAHNLASVLPDMILSPLNRPRGLLTPHPLARTMGHEHWCYCDKIARPLVNHASKKLHAPLV